MPDTFLRRAWPHNPSFLLQHRLLDALPWRFSRTALIQAILSATYLVAGALLFYGPSTPVRGAGLLIIVLGAAVGWLAASRRYHLIVDTPTSRIASAAQGYVELQGYCQLHPGSPPLGFRSGPPCVWYRYNVRRVGDSSSRLLDRGQSDETFLLDDGSGQCIVDPNQIDGKGTYEVQVQRMTTFMDSMVMCRMLEGIFGPVGLTEDHARLVKVTTGMDLGIEDLKDIADRIYSLERAVNLREGETRSSDTLPWRFMNEPIPTGASKGKCIPEDVLNKLLDETYDERGWDRKTGFPLKETLLRLKLPEVAREIYGL